MSMPLVRLSNVGKNYPLSGTTSDRVATLWDLILGRPIRRSRQILHDISLSVSPGCSVAIIGENGAGKSTLLKIVTGILRTSTGSVETRGRIGALLELGAGFHPDYTGRQNIRLSAALMGLGKAEIQHRTPEIIEFADIGEYIDEPIKHYSSGMVVRLGFAIVAATDPDLLITDEILAVGDESFQKKCITWLENFVRHGGTLLVVSHNMYHVRKLCAEAVWLQGGCIKQSGSVFDVTQAYLAYLEQKGTPESNREQVRTNGNLHHIETLMVNGISSPNSVWQMGDDLRVQGIVYSADQRCPVVAVGIVRINEVPVYGTTTENEHVVLGRLDSHHYAFELVFKDISLLPGAYSLRAHAMDPEGLRLFDSLPLDFIVRGESREFGMCRLPHYWVDSPTVLE